jgi:protease I
MAKILSVIAPEGYQDIEYNDSKKVLGSYSHTVVTASTVDEAHGKYGGTQKSDVLLSDVNVEDYDAILFVGGPGSHDYFDDPVAHNIAKAFLDAGKLTTAICAAPSILANAGLLDGITCTCFPSQADNLKEKGANYTGNPVEQDGLIITADGPDSATAFGKQIAEVLA